MKQLGWNLLGLYALAQAAMLIGAVLWLLWHVANLSVDKLLGLE